MIPFAFPSLRAIKVKTVIWVVNALVEATPISGPAWVYAPEWVSLEIEDPTTLQTPKTNAPFFLASFIAAKVSAVSPDWEIAITMSLSLMTGFLYLNSDAYSTSTGILDKPSKIYSASYPSFQEVKQENIVIFFSFRNLSMWLSTPAILINPLLTFNRPL